jgi:hypothetical protein
LIVFASDDAAARHCPLLSAVRELGSKDRPTAVSSAERILPRQAEAELHRCPLPTDPPLPEHPLVHGGRRLFRL